MPHILERTLNPGVAPSRILLRHPPHQAADFSRDAATTRAFLDMGPFAGDEPVVPAEQRVRRDDRRDPTQHLPAQSKRQRGKLPAVVIGQAQATPTQLPPQHPILFDQVREYLPLLTVEPARNVQEQHAESRDVDHGQELTALLSFWRLRVGRPRRGTLRPGWRSATAFSTASGRNAMWRQASGRTGKPSERTTRRSTREKKLSIISQLPFSTVTRFAIMGKSDGS